EPLPDDGLGLDFEQQMRAAAQVEAEIDLLFGQPVRQLFRRRAVEQIGRGEDRAYNADGEDQNDLPARNVDHRPGDKLVRARSGTAAAALRFAVFFVVVRGIGGALSAAALGRDRGGLV